MAEFSAFLTRYLDDRGGELLWEGKILRGSAKGKVQALATGIAEMPGVLAADPNDVPLAFAVHERYDDRRRSLVVVNNSDKPQRYKWGFMHAPVKTATLHAPFEKPRSVSADDEVVLAPQRLHVLVEER